MTQVNSILIGRAFHQAVQEIPVEIAARLVRESADKYAIADILDNKNPDDRSLEDLGGFWLESYPTAKESINGYLQRCGLQTVDDFIQLQSLKSGQQV